MKPNISILNAIMRITCGLTTLAWATSRMSRRPKSLSFLFIAMMGAMKVGEGIHRFCPVTEIAKQSLKSSENGSEKEHKSESE